MPNTNTAAIYNRIYLEVQKNKRPAAPVLRCTRKHSRFSNLLRRIDHHYAYAIFTVLSWGNHAGLWRWEASRK